MGAAPTGSSPCSRCGDRATSQGQSQSQSHSQSKRNCELKLDLKLDLKRLAGLRATRAFASKDIEAAASFADPKGAAHGWAAFSDRAMDGESENPLETHVAS